MRLSWLKATQYKRVPADWHQQLIESIASRDPDRAEAKMREHVQFGHEDDQAALEGFLAQSAHGPATRTTSRRQSAARKASS